MKMTIRLAKDGKMKMKLRISIAEIYFSTTSHTMWEKYIGGRPKMETHVTTGDACMIKYHARIALGAAPDSCLNDASTQTWIRFAFFSSFWRWKVAIFESIYRDEKRNDQKKTKKKKNPRTTKPYDIYLSLARKFFAWCKICARDDKFIYRRVGIIPR
jgi:hypothetical protein